MKNLFLFASILCLLILSSFLFFECPSVSAETEQEVEIRYPEIDGQRPVTVDSGELPGYINYIFQFLIIAAGIIAFGSLAYGGFLWMTSAGEPLKLQKSKSRIISSLVGLVIVLSSYIFLQRIDPTLIKLEDVDIDVVDDIHSPGVYLSLSGSFHDGDPDKIRENVRRINSSEGGLGKLQGEIKAFRIVNPTEEEDPGGEIIYRHLVVLHGEENFRGEFHILITNSVSENFGVSSNILAKTASISVARVQRRDQVPYGGVVAYDRTEFLEGSGWERLMPTDSLSPFTDIDQGPWSIDIDGAYAIILASGGGWNQMQDECAIFTTSRPITSLYGHYMNRCEPHWYSAFFAAYESCATHYALFPLYR